MAKKSPSVHRAALLASAVAVLGLLTACGSSGGGTASAPTTLPGTAAPATGGHHSTDTASASASAAGTAFVDASGKQLGPDPKRSSGSPTTVTLAPGKSAWAGLTFSNPDVSGAHAATPASLLVTPPDERDHLTVTWKGGQVPVSGNASSVFLTVFSPGTGP